MILSLAQQSPNIVKVHKYNTVLFKEYFLIWPSSTSYSKTNFLLTKQVERTKVRKGLDSHTDLQQRSILTMVYYCLLRIATQFKPYLEWNKPEQFPMRINGWVTKARFIIGQTLSKDYNIHSCTEPQSFAVFKLL